MSGKELVQKDEDGLYIMKNGFRIEPPTEDGTVFWEGCEVYVGFTPSDSYIGLYRSGELTAEQYDVGVGRGNQPETGESDEMWVIDREQILELTA